MEGLAQWQARLRRPVAPFYSRFAVGVVRPGCAAIQSRMRLTPLRLLRRAGRLPTSPACGHGKPQVPD
ncbi:MAG TPA: hypothetical protein VJ834_10010, partial [Burkholderiales bacterium]|nr:hypothetical protein [Burkholderiales bacterium]